jgi:hypothetical protein
MHKDNKKDSRKSRIIGSRGPKESCGSAKGKPCGLKKICAIVIHRVELDFYARYP